MHAFRLVSPKARGWLASAAPLALCLGAGASLCLAAKAQTGSPAVSTGTPATAGSPAPADAARAELLGEVTDGSGALVPGAVITLRAATHEPVRSTETDREGQFRFSALAAGNYELSITAPGFDAFTSAPVPLAAGEVRRVGDLVLKIPLNHADAYVTMSQKDIAAAEIHAAEQQRILGFPDFYTSFVWNAEPMSARQKFGLGAHATTDRMAFVTAGLVASGEQVKGTFPEFGGGWQGFGKRYGAAYADGFIGKYLGSAVLPSVFRQDPRYFYMGSNGTVKQRVRHAVLSGVLTRGDNGRTQLNYSHILGNAGAGALSTLYHPAADSAGKLALDNALLGTLGEAGVNVVREFFLKRFVRGGDVDANGMP